MTNTLDAICLIALVLGTSVWLGGYVAIAVVARVTTRTIEPSARVAFFRALGRAYFWVGTPALLVALVSAGVLARDVESGPLFSVTVAAAALLVVCFAVAVGQARRMTRLRIRLADSSEDPSLEERVRRGAVRAGVLRAALGVLSLVLVVAGSFLAT